MPNIVGHHTHVPSGSKYNLSKSNGMGVLVFGEQEILSEKGQEPTMNYNRI